MNPDVVYGKTAKGLEEMSQRTYKLAARMRTLLIMIDGKTPAAGIIGRSPSPEETTANIVSLLQEGFIEAKGLGPSHAAKPNVAPAGVDPVERARRFIVTSLVGALGPDADHFTGKVEAARDMSALTELASKYLEVVRTGGGARRAEAFRAGLLEHGVIKDSLDLPVAAPAPREPSPEQAIEARRVNNTRKVMIRFLLDTLGPDADNFTGKVDTAATTTELRQLAARHLEIVRAAVGARKAEEFRQLVLDALNS